MCKSWLSGLFGALVVLSLPTLSSAGPGGGHGGGGGHSSGGAGHVSGGGGGRVGGAYYGGRVGGAYYGGRGGVGIYGGIYLGGLGYGYGSSYPYSYDYGPYNYGPSVYVAPSTTYVVPSTSNSYYYAPPAVNRPVMPPADPQAAQATNATILVRVPPDAEIWFEGDKTSQSGSLRTFETPNVPAGRAFTYDVRAKWIGSNGQVFDQTRQVQFRAGQRITLDFTRE